MVDDLLVKGKQPVLGVASETSLSMPKVPALEETFVECEGENLYGYIGATVKKPMIDYF